MKKLLLPLLFIPIVLPAAEQSKDEMRQNLKKYVQENQEASATIAPLIEKLTSILDAQEAKKKNELKQEKKEVDSLLKR